MKRILSVLFLIALMPFTAYAAEPYKTMPDIFAVSVRSDDYMIGKNEAYIYKEYLKTTNKAVNSELQEIVDGYDRDLAPTMKKRPEQQRQAEQPPGYQNRILPHG